MEQKHVLLDMWALYYCYYSATTVVHYIIKSIFSQNITYYVQSTYLHTFPPPF